MTTTEFRPLAGLNIVSLALNVPGPMALERLRNLGAVCHKVEPPGGDPLQGFAPDWYAALIRGMSVETLDLQCAAGRDRLLALLGSADLLLTAFRPAALDRLGLGWEALHARFPRLAQVALVGYPAPHENLAGHDLTYLATHGLVAPPALPATLYSDAAASETVVSAVLALLLERARTGGGAYLEVALSEAARRLAAPRHFGLTGPGRLLGGGFAGYCLYRSADGWLAVAALEPHFFARLRELLCPVDDSPAAFAQVFAGRRTADWLRLATTHDLPIVEVSA